MPPQPRKTAPGRATTPPAPRLVQNANFVSKRERKRVRKDMVRAYMRNRVADYRINKAERREFYRLVPWMKQRRLAIARELRRLELSLDALANDTSMTLERCTNLPGSTRTAEEIRQRNDCAAAGDEAVGDLNQAVRALSTATDEFMRFAKRPIYFTEAAQ